MDAFRKGQTPPPLTRNVFQQGFRARFADHAYERECDAPARHRGNRVGREGRKAPVTPKAGPEYADANYDLSVEWLETHNRRLVASAKQKTPATPSRVLLIAGAARNDGNCPAEISKIFRLAQIAREVLYSFRATVAYRRR